VERRKTTIVRGRKPKPLQKQIAEGDPRQRGMRNLRERLAGIPQAGKGLPKCPAALGPIAQYAWRFWKAELEQMDLAFRPDRMMLEGACVHYERAKQADEIIQKHGLVVVDVATDATGKPAGRRHVHRNPAISISNASWALVRSFCSEFGLSPIGRQRLDVKPDHDRSHEELMAALSQPRAPRTNVQ
jgi:P27 family predicted phage terminase small subunit